jgi:hypothetical protein
MIKALFMFCSKNNFVINLYALKYKPLSNKVMNGINEKYILVE